MEREAIQTFGSTKTTGLAWALQNAEEHDVHRRSAHDATPAHFDPSGLYDRAFFEQYGPVNAPYANACAFIGQTLCALFQPRSVVDFGCGAGLHLLPFARAGVHVLGVDGSAVAVHVFPDGLPMLAADLRLPFSLSGLFLKHDLALCLDVLEHVEERFSTIALGNVVRATDTVVLSCAPPGQGGHYHVNEQPRRYWISKMRELGFQYDRRSTGRLERFFRERQTHVPWSWMYHNLCIYRRVF